MNIKKKNKLINLQKIYLNYFDDDDILNKLNIFKRLINLKKLEICGEIKEIPDNLINLEYLNIEHNGLKQIPNTLINLQKLILNSC